MGKLNMRTPNIADEIKQGENETIEFKRDLPAKDSKLMKTVTAFSNGKGGKIVFGIDDKTHKVTGIENDKVFKFMDSLADMISNSISPQINPQITFETIENKTIVIAEILQGQNPPYFIKSEGSLDGVYVRVAATTRKAEREKIKELVLWGEGKSYDRTFENHECADKNAVQRLRADIEKYSHRTVTTENLIGLGLLRQDGDKLSPSVADVFLRMGIVEKWGTGIKRVEQLCKQYGLRKVKFTADDDFFTATIFRAEKSPEENVPVNVPASERHKLILDLLGKNPEKTAAVLAKEIGVTEKTIKRDIQKLKENDLIARTGSDKSGHWIVKDKGN